MARAWETTSGLVFLRDFPVMTGLLIFVSFMVIVGNLLTDMAYALLDPRIKYR